MAKILEEYPPNWEFIKQKFPGIEGAPIVVTYGDTIYNPHKAHLPDHLIAHEEVHMRQQAAHPGGIEAYMHKFADDIHFRLEVEIEAYITQLRFIRAQNPGLALRYLPVFAQHLSSPIYGNAISAVDAMDRLRSYLLI